MCICAFRLRWDFANETEPHFEMSILAQRVQKLCVPRRFADAMCFLNHGTRYLVLRYSPVRLDKGEGPAFVLTLLLSA